MIIRVIGTPPGTRSRSWLFPLKGKQLASRPMERVFEAETREEANRKADEWWAKAKGMRFVHRCQTPPGFRSNPSQRWVIVIHYLEEVFPVERYTQTRVVR